MTPEPLPRRLAPYGLVLVLALAAWLAGALAPYRVDTDTGFQLHSLQQWVRGESPDPGTLRLPDPADLSRDTLVWSTWWPPGFPFVYAPLAAAGLSLAGTLRATSFLLFLAGSLGWLRLADRLGLSRPVRLLYALSLAAYAVTVGGAATLPWAEVLTFAFAPWLAAAVWSQARGEPRYAMLFLVGLGLGAAYWLKYTLFLVAVPMAAWLALRLLRHEGPAVPLTVRLGRATALGLGCALPVLALLTLNLQRSRGLADSAAGNRASWVAVDPDTARPLPLALALAGAPGLGLFQNHLWITHGLYFSDTPLPFLREVKGPRQLLAKSLLGIPGTVALIWGLARARRNRDRVHGSLALAATAGFYLLLTAVSLAIRYNYLSNEPRFGVACMPLLHPLILAGWMPGPGEPRRARAISLAVFGLFFVLPLLFAAADFLLNQIGDRREVPYTASSTGLFVPELSSRDVPAVQSAVASALHGPRDIVVLAGGPIGWGSSFITWLESPWRTLPVSTFTTPLGGHYAQAADLRSRSPLVSSRGLRVVLVVSRSLVRDGWLPRLQARFPQARAWRSAPVPPGAEVAITFSDLEVR